MKSFDGTGSRCALAHDAGLVLLGVVVVLLVSLWSGVGVGSWIAVAATPPPPLWKACETGSGAGDCRIPRGVAADPNNGHVFVADQLNFRIDEFDSLGHFVKAWGWDVIAGGPGDTGSGFEICVPGNGDICKAGTEGTGAGQFGAFGPQGLALDSSGNVYVVDFLNQRVQKFDSEGHFLLMFGGEGTGSGQFNWDIETVGSFIAIDTKGTEVAADDKVYVGDRNRIQRFDTGGVFQGELALPGETVKSLATDTSGNLYAIFKNKPDVHKLAPTEPTPTVLAPMFEVEEPTAVAVDLVGHVFAFGPTTTGSGSVVYIDPIFEFEPDGTQIAKFGKGEFSASTGLATNLCAGSEAPGNLYVTNAGNSEESGGEQAASVRAYGTQPIGCFKARTLPASNVEEATATLNGTVNPDGSAVSECIFEYGTSAEPYEHTVECAESPAEIGVGTEPVPVHADIGGLDPGTVYHFRLLAKVGGEPETGADESFKTKGPPVISADHTAGATDTEATLKALVNSEGLPTSCRFEYGPDASYGQSTPERAIGEDRADHTTIVTLKGLIPGTTYHWRIVCTNSSGTTAGEDHTVTTYRPFATETNCANQAFRTAASAFLPDCRAYEMVSPVDKNGGDIISGLLGAGNPGGYVQVSRDGERIAYGASPSFADQPSSFDINQYLAARQEGDGWSNHGIHPPVMNRPATSVLFGHLRDFMAFSPDLCSAWLIDYQTPTLTPDAQDGYPNLYRRDNCGADAGSLEAITTAPLPPGTSDEYVGSKSVQGVSEDSRHTVFVAQAALTADEVGGLYDHFDGELHLVSVRPDGNPDSTGASGGSGWLFNLDHAVSEDGARVYWTSVGTGKIYLRLHPERPQSDQAIGSATGRGDLTAGSKTVTNVVTSSGTFAVGQTISAAGILPGTTIAAVGANTLTLSSFVLESGPAVALEAFSECSEAAKACTLPVSASNNAFFWTAAADGSKALYSEGADLFEFDLQSKSSQLIAHSVKGVAGASDDLSRIYFVSSEALSDGAQAGEPNLYLEDEGTLRFVATLVEGDVGIKEPGASTGVYEVAGQESYYRATRVTPDGAHIAFQSRAPLTGFDNADAVNGKADVEVFAYEAGGELHCVSCSPSGGRPGGLELQRPYLSAVGKESSGIFAAAWIPTWEHPLHASNVLSEDGGRLFFNSNEALLPRDTNGTQDVYEWEAPGVGSCKEESPSFFQSNGGCLYLISSGESPFESEFWEASPDGRDVFFTTESSLLPQDPGLVDLYDARAGGGFAQPNPKAACEGEACQSPPPPPAFRTPASSAYPRPGNAKPKNPKRCPKGKRKVRRHGKVRCVKSKGQKKHQRGANHNRRAGR